MSAFAHATTRTLEEALVLLSAQTTAKPIAGGTDLLNVISAGLENPSLLVDLKPVAELYVLSENARDGLKLGALVTLTRLARERVVAAHYDVLRQAIHSAASPQLRNMGTVGGNMCQRPRCWYFRGAFTCLKKGGDMCYAVGGENQDLAILGGGPCYIVHPSDLAPALIALDAHVVIASVSSQAVLPLDQFFVLPRFSVGAENVLDPEQIIVQLQVKRPSSGSRGVYLKAMERKAWAFAQSSVAVHMRLSRGIARDVRVVLGGVAPIPWRARDAESVLEGGRITQTVAVEAGRRAVAAAEPMSKNAYKIPLTKVLVERAVLAVGGQVAGH